MAIVVAVDVMGGDHGPSATVPAALQFLAQSRDCRVLLVGKPDVIESELKRAAA